MSLLPSQMTKHELINEIHEHALVLNGVSTSLQKRRALIQITFLNKLLERLQNL